MTNAMKKRTIEVDQYVDELEPVVLTFIPSCGGGFLLVTEDPFIHAVRSVSQSEKEQLVRKWESRYGTPQNLGEYGA